MGHATAGRYKDVSRAPIPGELPPEGAVNAHCLIVHGGVADPNSSLRGRRQRVAINVKTDALEREYQLGRIDEGAYQAARTYQRVLQRSRIPSGGGGSWAPRDRVDQVASREMALNFRLDRAAEATAMLADTAPTLGMIAQRLMELVLVDELTLSEAATRLRGSADRQHVIFYANLFRESCEALSLYWSRRDKCPPKVW